MAKFLSSENFHVYGSQYIIFYGVFHFVAIIYHIVHRGLALIYKLSNDYYMTIHAVAVIHTPDMERILSLLRILITKRVEIIDLKFDQTGSVVTKRREDLRILYLVNSILDVALSVAASVIASLLLLSGDIEQNPGPGKEQ